MINDVQNLAAGKVIDDETVVQPSLPNLENVIFPDVLHQDYPEVPRRYFVSRELLLLNLLGEVHLVRLTDGNRVIPDELHYTFVLRRLPEFTSSRPLPFPCIDEFDSLHNSLQYCR